MRIGTKSSNGAGAGDYVITGAGYANGILTLSESTGGTATLTVRALSDSQDEDGESVTLVLGEYGGSLPEGWELGAIRRHVVTLNEEPRTTIGFASVASEVSEGDTATLGLVFTGYTIPSDGVNLKFDVSGTANVNGTDDDAEYNNGSLTNNLQVSLDQSDTSFSINILSNTVLGGEEDETLVLTLRGVDLPSGVTLGDISKHTITIPANGNSAFFGRNASSPQISGTVNESDDTATLMVSLSLAGAPTDGLPLKIAITSGNDGNDRNLVTFNSDGTAENMQEFMVPAGMTSHPVTVYINDNSIDADHEDIVFTLTPGSDFPGGWGAVDGNADTYTLTVTDDDGTIGFASEASEAREGTAAEVSLAFTGYTIPSDGVDLKFDVSGSVNLSGNDPDALYNSGSITNPLIVRFRQSDNANPSFSINIPSDGVLNEEDETLVLTLQDADLRPGVTLGDISKHTITILANGNSAFFGRNVSSPQISGAVSKDGATVVLPVSLSTGAPLGGLPLKIEITSGNDDNLVTLNRDRTANNSYAFTVDAGQTSHDVTVYINDKFTDDTHPQVRFTLSKGDTFPDGWGDVNPFFSTFTLAIRDYIQFVQTEVSFREPYADEVTGVPVEIHDVLDGGCAGPNQRNCIVYYFDLEITGVPEEPFDMVIDKWSESKGNALGGGFSDTEWGYPIRHRITPEDARDGRIRVPIAIASDNEFEMGP